MGRWPGPGAGRVLGLLLPLTDLLGDHHFSSTLTVSSSPQSLQNPQDLTQVLKYLLKGTI